MTHIALSYSRLSTYEQCPAKFAAQYIDKTYPDESKNPHFIKGSKKHKQLENYINCKNDLTQINMMYDGDVQNVFPIIDGLFNSGYVVQAEQQMSVGKDWQPVDWFSKQSMYRSIVDCIAVKEDIAQVIDFKTGKFRDYDSKDTGQLHLSSAVIFAIYPEINVIKTAYLYIEHRQSVVRQFTRDMYNNGLCQPFNEAFKLVNTDETFEPKRNEYCNWCLIKDTCDLFNK